MLIKPLQIGASGRSCYKKLKKMMVCLEYVFKLKNWKNEIMREYHMDV